MISTSNVTETPIVKPGTYTCTENMGGVQITRYIHVDRPAKPNITTTDSWPSCFVVIDYHPRTYR